MTARAELRTGMTIDTREFRRGVDGARQVVGTFDSKVARSAATIGGLTQAGRGLASLLRGNLLGGIKDLVAGLERANVVSARMMSIFARAAPVLIPLAVGWKTGKFLDEKFGISDRIGRRLGGRDDEEKRVNEAHANAMAAAREARERYVDAQDRLMKLRESALSAESKLAGLVDARAFKEMEMARARATGDANVLKALTAEAAALDLDIKQAQAAKQKADEEWRSARAAKEVAEAQERYLAASRAIVESQKEIDRQRREQGENVDRERQQAAQENALREEREAKERADAEFEDRLQNIRELHDSKNQLEKQREKELKDFRKAAFDADSDLRKIGGVIGRGIGFEERRNAVLSAPNRGAIGEITQQIATIQGLLAEQIRAINELGGGGQ